MTADSRNPGQAGDIGIGFRAKRGGVPLDAIEKMSDLQARHEGTELNMQEMLAVSDLYDAGLSVSVSVFDGRLSFGLSQRRPGNQSSQDSAGVEPGVVVNHQEHQE